jgi:hypothetical protein
VHGVDPNFFYGSLPPGLTPRPPDPDMYVLQRRVRSRLLPPAESQQTRDQPAFPFQFIRYDAFLDTVKTLAGTGRCSYHPFDWNTLSTSEHRREVRFTKPVVIEGVSALNPALCDLYGLKIFVESDSSTAFQAALRRGDGAWEREWRELFLPSVDIYMLTRPERRADLLVPGRGIG